MNLYQPTISGSLTVSGSVEIIGPFTMSGGSISGTSSFAANAGLLQGLDSTSFVGTGSYNTLSSSFTTVSSSYSAASGSFSTRVSTLETASGSFSGRVSKIEGNYATTGSNIFTGAQTVCANITSTGTIIAQTLNVQQVTSSVVYSSGSNIFGCLSTDVQQMTGSLRVTGSGASYFLGGNTGIGTSTPNMRLDVSGSGLGGGIRSMGASGASGGKGVEIGYELGDFGTVLAYDRTGGVFKQLRINDLINVGIGSTGCVGIGTTTPQRLVHASSNTENGIYISCYSSQLVIGNNHTFASKTCSTTIALAGGDGDYFPTACGGDTIIATQAGNIRFGTGMNAGVASGTERFRITNTGIAVFTCQVCAPVGVFSGCVGIGTGSPQDKLYIIGADNGITICSLTQNRPVLSLVNGSTTMLKLSANGTYGAIASCTGDLMYFYGGNIGIGQTNPSFGLEVYSSAATAVTSNNTFSANFNLIFNRDNTGSTRNCFNFLADQNAAYIRTLDNYPINFVTNGQNRILLTNTGIACFACQVCTPSGIRFGNGTSTINYYCSADWAPQFYAGGSTSFGLSTQTGSGKFTRIGNVVFLHGQISWSGAGSGGCTLLSIQNLPFRITCNARGGVAAGIISGISQIASGGLNLIAEIDTCIIYFTTNCGNGGAHIHLTGDAVTSGGSRLFSFGGSYITNDAS